MVLLTQAFDDLSVGLPSLACSPVGISERQKADRLCGFTNQLKGAMFSKLLEHTQKMLRVIRVKVHLFFTRIVGVEAKDPTRRLAREAVKVNPPPGLIARALIAPPSFWLSDSAQGQARLSSITSAPAASLSR